MRMCRWDPGSCRSFSSWNRPVPPIFSPLSPQNQGIGCLCNISCAPQISSSSSNALSPPEFGVFIIIPFFFVPKTLRRNSARMEFHISSLITPLPSRLSETRPGSHCFCVPGRGRGDGLVSFLSAFNYSQMEIKTGAIPLSCSRR